MSHFSRIFPARPRSLASVLIPRPSALAVLLLLRRPRGFRLSENLLGKETGTQKDFPNLPKKHAFGTRERGTSRRFAQECPEGNPGKYRQGETQWHSTKTKSL